MRINMNVGTGNNFFNNCQINKNLNKNNIDIKNSEQQERKDTVYISPLGKTSSLIESLMKQKESITENKNKLISATIEKGGNIDSIKSQLDCFEEQLKNIDKQIAKTTSEQLKQQVESQKEIVYKKPKTEEEIENEHLNLIANLSSSFKQAQMVSSVKTKVDGESRVLEIEIKLDGSRGIASEVKKQRVDELQKQSASLTTHINEEFIEINEEIKDNNDNQLIETKNSEATKNSELNSKIEHKIQSSIADSIDNKANNVDSDKN